MSAQPKGFWEENWGYFFWFFIGILSAIAGYLQPINNEYVALAAVVIIFVIGLATSLLITHNLGSFLVILGFGYFLIAIYILGFFLASMLWGFAILTLIACILLFTLGAIGVEIA